MSAIALTLGSWRVAFVAAGIVGEEADTLRDSLTKSTLALLRHADGY
jgi:hypothetical protein